MKLIEATDATAIVTTVIKYFTENWAALAVLIGFGVGLKLFRSFVNRGLKGRIQRLPVYRNFGEVPLSSPFMKDLSKL